jgi:drug/metabolite transporter superfamily protein YnfA
MWLWLKTENVVLFGLPTSIAIACYVAVVVKRLSSAEEKTLRGFAHAFYGALLLFSFVYVSVLMTAKASLNKCMLPILSSCVVVAAIEVILYVRQRREVKPTAYVHGEDLFTLEEE